MNLQDDHERQVCRICGMAFTDQRQHTDWHVDQRLKRLQPPDNPVASHLLTLLTAEWQRPTVEGARS